MANIFGILGMLDFPLNFPYLRILAQPSSSAVDIPFTIAAMVTPSHSRFGQRLLDSCKQHRLPLFMLEVPAVHCSISPKGTKDLHYTKPNFIHFVLQETKKPVLYLDADMVIKERPVKFEDLISNNIDFAIFNWLNDIYNAAYRPMQVEIAGHDIAPNRFYCFARSIDLYDPSQLICSGAAQFWNNTSAAWKLLKSWHSVIQMTPYSPDDQCLDFAYNNRSGSLLRLRTAWLDKSYCRYSHWIFTRPILDHPQFPSSGDGVIELYKAHIGF